ncbi:MAG TPA: alpha/beta fold hydrolase [Rhizomicrobium sp.]|nr:alpha/beta fold hydrolase [Rhizomicrobium sp.]
MRRPNCFLAAALCAGTAAAVFPFGEGARAAAPGSSSPAATTDDYSKPLLLLPRAVSEAILSSPAGHPHRIVVSAPQAGEPKDGYPVIYVLDGDGWMGAAVEIAKMREFEKLDPAIVVGIGYPSRSFFDALGRSYDFSPPGSSEPDFEGIPLGGADDFLAFLNGTVKPWLQTHYAINPNRQILFGHSMGGLFALYALYKAPDNFATFIAASPDLPFSNHILSAWEAAFERNPARVHPRVLITVGELEARPSPALVGDYRRYYMAHPESHPGQTTEEAVKELFSGIDDKYDKIADTRGLTERLSRAGVRATFVEFAGEEHMSSAISALNRGIPFALRPAP